MEFLEFTRKSRPSIQKISKNYKIYKPMKFFSTFLFLLITMMSFAQGNQGSIVYEQTVDLHRRLTGERERMKQFVPKTMSNKFQLQFTAKESMYEAYLDEEEDPGPGGGRRFRFMGMGSDGEMYRNFEEMRFVNSREFEGKKYLIKGEIAQTPWKVTGQTREIAGFPCMQAIYDDTLEQQELTAWFTPTIPVAAGPSIYGQLPGLIIALDINNGEIVYRPLEINFDAPEAKDLEEPTKGKDITREEFEEMLRQRMEEMRAQRQQEGGRPGGSGGGRPGGNN